jgi:6-pyruvoyltetrahydropterin/6-carboxytetrahydropterin synthase
MYEIKKTFEISAAHFLTLDYPSKCAELHGHNWRVTVYLRSAELNANGMVMDFTEIKKKITAKLDHKVLNDVLDFNPTAENLARYICGELAPFCYRTDVRESEGNTATYWKPDEDIPRCTCGYN